MKAAVFLKNNKLTTLNEEKLQVVIFKLENDKVVGVESPVLKDREKDSILSWLIHHSINEVYVSEIEDSILDKINLHGIQVKTIETLKEDKLYNSMSLSSLNLETVLNTEP